MKRANSLEKTLMLGKIEDRRTRGRQKMRLLGGIINSMDMSLRNLMEIVKNREAWHGAIHGITKIPTELSNWTRKSRTYHIAHGALLSTLWHPGW